MEDVTKKYNFSDFNHQIILESEKIQNYLYSDNPNNKQINMQVFKSQFESILVFNAWLALLSIDESSDFVS